MEQAAFGIVDIQEFYDLDVKLVSTELNRFEMIAFLFPQIRGHSKRSFNNYVDKKRYLGRKCMIGHMK